MKLTLTLENDEGPSLTLDLEIGGWTIRIGLWAMAWPNKAEPETTTGYYIDAGTGLLEGTSVSVKGTEHHYPFNGGQQK